MQPVLLALVLMPPILAIWTYLDHSLLRYRVGGYRALCLLTVLVLAGLKMHRIALARPARTTVAACLMFVAVLFAAFFTATIARAPAEAYLSRNLVLLLFAWFLFSAYAQRNADQRNALFAAVLGGSTLFLLVMLAIIAIHAGDASYDWVNFWVGVTHTRHIGYFTTIHVAIAAALLGLSGNRGERIALGAALLLGLTVANIAGGRASIMAGLMAAFACAAIADPAHRRRNLAWVAALFAVSLPLSLVQVPPHPMWGVGRLSATMLGEAVSGGYANSRELLWARAAEAIPRHPWIGWGEGQFRTLQEGIWQANHPHNIVLQALVSYGIIGSLAIFWLVWSSIARSLVRVWRDPAAHLVPLAVIFGLALLSLTDGPLFYQGPLQVFVIACVMARLAGQKGAAASS